MFAYQIRRFFHRLVEGFPIYDPDKMVPTMIYCKQYIDHPREPITPEEATYVGVYANAIRQLYPDMDKEEYELMLKSAYKTVLNKLLLIVDKRTLKVFYDTLRIAEGEEE